MKTPPLLMTAALLLWGWQVDVLIWALLIAVVLEGSRFVSTKWEFATSDLHRVFDLCGLLFFGAIAVLFASDETINRPFQFARWQPFIFLPLMLAQAFGNQEKIPLSAMSWMLRGKKDHPLSKKGFNVSYLYFAVCLLGASAGNTQGKWFYPAMALIISCALLAVKPIRFKMPVWMAMLLVAALAGYFAQFQLRRMQVIVEESFARWIAGMFQRDPDTRRSRTSIGRVGRLKLSGKIVWRVESKPGEAPPLLLRQVTYDNYYGDREGTWMATRTEYGDTVLETNDIIRLLPEKESFRTARIAGALSGGRGVLPLPLGSFQLVDLPAMPKTNAMAVAKIEEGPTFVNFEALHGPGASLDGLPSETDLAVPENEKAVLAQIAEELQLASLPEKERLGAIQSFFQKNFSYSTYIESAHVDAEGKQTPLNLFLTKVRSGHCEYFATATVLLLRQTGIPARYAVGYAVQEGASQRKFVVRERHAHAWTLVHLDGAWHDFDTTPPSWNEAESAHAKLWEPLSDFFSRLRFEFSKWRWSKTSYTQYLVWALIPLSLFLVWRIVFKARRQKAAASRDENAKRPWPGLDSEFYQLERRVAELGLTRREGEPLMLWRQRLNSPIVSADKLESIMVLHHRYRFDPNGISAEERQRLRNEVESLLQELNQRSAAN